MVPPLVIQIGMHLSHARRSAAPIVRCIHESAIENATDFHAVPFNDPSVCYQFTKIPKSDPRWRVLPNIGFLTFHIFKFYFKIFIFKKIVSAKFGRKIGTHQSAAKCFGHFDKAKYGGCAIAGLDPPPAPRFNVGAASIFDGRKQNGLQHSVMSRRIVIGP